jgi:signal transduction histidine kinase
MSSELKAERARLSLISAQIFVPMIGRKQLIGWITLSPRTSGEPYDLLDLSYLDTLSDQAALAVARAQIVVDLQRRVHEMNVLGRVAQGINVTLEFDDILELIYSQTAQVVPVDHFRITLFDEITDTYRHVFYLDAGERLIKQENLLVPKGLGLELEVIRTSRTIQTDDYDSECRRRSVIPFHRDVYAWLGVPLTAGTRTIGALCLSSRDAAVMYAEEQISIIQSIADQAAGAITKTQLLAESERRTRQLETLNQVARSLTLELELDPLLNRILESAVEIFNCEAGTLFLVEEDTGEIVFSVVVGGAEDLVGTRLAPGTGLVGKCVDTGRPIIQNDVQSSEDWFGVTDQETGFTTQGLMVVPMSVRDELIGVIEVINKLDRSPFTPDDERLLMAFSAQAAVAVQNARLFTQTDQALADRVDELSVLQRIDRELNTSLELPRAMRITLDWAMRQSRADAGLIALLEDGVLKVAERQGYPVVENVIEFNQRVGELKVTQNALAQTQPRAILNKGEAEGLLLVSNSQVAAPLQRGGIPIGVLLLESKDQLNFTDQAMQFLNRLSDHAAIAIANATLYSELEEANIAKSDFISFVSHELKTPMTSIKGYADLLAQGAVGEINDAQAGFLTTIRSNVNRMATLVSDLADISRIEAGRLRLDYGAVSIWDVVDEVMRSSEREVQTKALNLELDVSEELPSVWGDHTRLVQVLTNLVSNAVKYTPQDGTMRVRAGISETQDSATMKGLIQVEVTDSGIGIRPDEQEQIFTKFFRSEDLKAREAPGTGLGLNITKNLVELQGGNIWFESVYRTGTTFYFTIPIAGTV